MEQVAAEAHTEGTDLGNIKRRIDGKGIVIFTLESGSSTGIQAKSFSFPAMIPRLNTPPAGTAD